MAAKVMTNRIRSEAVQLLLSPMVALRDLKFFITGSNADKDDDQQVNQNDLRILIDKDGNATLNLDNAEVRKQMQAHIEALAKIKVAESDDNVGRHERSSC